MAVLGRRSDASFEYDQQPDTPATGQLWRPGQLSQLLPGGPPLGPNSSALN
jgi:hypothetical protein